MTKRIIREKYLERIRPFIGKDLIKVLIGCRRVGKTTILLQLADEIKGANKANHVIYINKEAHEFKDIKTNEDLYAYVKSKTKEKGKHYLIIDEVQEIQGFEIALRQLLLETYDIYCSGSNANMLSGDLATHLSGRYIEIQINALSYDEFLIFHERSNTNEALMDYIKYGGLPYLSNIQLEEGLVYDYLKSVYNTIILKDVVSRYKIRDIDFLERLIDYLSDTLGSYVSSKKITDFLKSQAVSLSINTVLNYLSYLSAAFFIQKARRYDIVGKKRFEINDKFYFADLGLKHAIIPYQVDDIGKVLENLVYNKLIDENFDVYVGKYNQYEIDFVAQKGDETIYIQVAYLLSTQKTIDREFGTLLKIKDNYPKYVISADELIGKNYKGIKHINIRAFLLSQKKTGFKS
jgi:predicted AAA+ superfamily ATPase